MTRNLFRIASLFLAQCLFLPGAAGAADNSIVIGQAIDLSSVNGSTGRDYVAGIKTFFDSLNAAGGIGGKKVRYVVRDDEGSPSRAASLVTAMIEQDQVDYLIGGVGDANRQAVLDAPAFRRSGMLLFAPLATANARPGDQTIWWRPSYQQEIQYLLNHFGRLGIRDVGIVVQEAPMNSEAYGSLSTEIRQRGMKVTGTVRIGNSAEQISEEAKRLAATRPGFVVVIADTIGTALFLKSFRLHEPGKFVASTSLINLDTLREVAGIKAVEWTVFSQVVPNPNSGQSPLQNEHRNMMRKYRDETLSSLTLEGFAAAKSLAAAIRLSKRGGRHALTDLLSQGADIDLGGLSIICSAQNSCLSNYLDIALFRKGAGLVF